LISTTTNWKRKIVKKVEHLSNLKIPWQKECPQDNITGFLKRSLQIGHRREGEGSFFKIITWELFDMMIEQRFEEKGYFSILNFFAPKLRIPVEKIRQRYLGLQ